MSDQPKKAGRKPSKELFENGTYSIEEWHDTFIDFEDMTEYKPAKALCGSWKEWNRLKRDWPALAGYIDEWREELEILLRSRACENIQNLLQSEVASTRLQAAKFLSEGGWNKRAGAGRPTASAKKREVNELARNAAETAEEEKRMKRILDGGTKQATIQ